MRQKERYEQVSRYLANADGATRGRGTGQREAGSGMTTHLLTCNSTHPFFKTLSSHPRFLSKHFTQNFLSSAPVCACQRFPIYASKLPPTSASSSPALPPELSHLCLVCARWFTSTTYAGGRLHHLWNRHLENEWAAYYQRFYTQEEEDTFISEESYGDRARRFQFTLNQIFPILKACGGIRCESEIPAVEEENEEALALEFSAELWDEGENVCWEEEEEEEMKSVSEEAAKAVT